MRTRRRRYFVKPSFQIRYIGVILIAVFLVASICISSTFYSSISLLGEKLGNVYPQGRLVVTLREINFIIAFRILCLVPLIAVIGILLSHKIAGPAYRIERALREIGKGNLDIQIKLRKYDELQGIAEAINEMTSDLKGIVKKGNET